MARAYPFNNGVLMLRDVSAPFFERVGCSHQSGHLGAIALQKAYLSPGENRFFVILIACAPKKTPHSCTY